MSVFYNNALIGASGQATSAYQISRSLRFNSADSAYLSRTPASAGNRKTWTWAGWVKRSKSDSNNAEVFGAGSNNLSFSFINDNINIYEYNGSSTLWQRTTSAVFRDFSAWYHVAIAYDTTQATAANRVKIYVNGTEITAFSTSTDPSLNFDGYVNNNIAHYICRQTVNNRYFNGYLADIHFIDGQALTPSSFGQLDTNNVWQPKAYTGSYGTNGFHLDFADNSTAAALGYDAAGSNDWTVNNLSVYSTSLNTIYSPPTGFSVWADPFATGVSNVTYSNNSKTASANITSEKTVITTGAKSSGKWYIEFTRTGIGDPADEVWGLVANNSAYPGATGTGGVGTTYTRAVFNSLGSGTSVTPSVPNFANGAVCQIAVDFDAKRVWWGVDNVWSSSGNPSTGSNPTFSAWTGSPVWYAAQRLYSSGNTATINSGPAAVLTGNDSLVDSPTNYGTDTGAGGEVRGNYGTLNPVGLGGGTLSNGNLSVSTSTDIASVSAFAMTTGKWYWEVTLTTSSNPRVGVYNVGAANPAGLGATANGWCLLNGPSRVFNNGSTTNYGTFLGNNGDVVMLAYDADAGKLWYGVNGSWFASGNPATGANPSQSSVTGSAIVPASSSGTGANVHDFNFGQRPFAYTAPSGFKALCTANLPEPTIANGATAMDVKLYTGNGSTQTISGLNFSPDLVWIKSRNISGYWHELFDSVRGVSRRLFSNDTSAEDFRSGQGLTAFNGDGFTLTYVDGNDNGNNSSGNTFVAWTWDAGTSTVTNTQGSITSQVRANASAGFSIVSWTSSGLNASFGHGLGVAPALVIARRRNVAENWIVYHKNMGGNNGYLLLQSTAAFATGVDPWASTDPTSTIVSYKNQWLGAGTGNPMIAYCFAPVAGYSAFGSYTGNGSADGPFVYTGFRPRWLMWKASSAAGYDWRIIDTARDQYNASGLQLYPNTAGAEGDYRSSLGIDLLSNGFKLRNASYENNNGIVYIYAAFAESPFALARAR